MMSQTSPYQAPVHAPDVTVWTLFRETFQRYGAWVGLCLPVVAALPLYLTWAIAGLTLGHTPLPGLNDPKYISDGVSAVYTVAVFGVISLLPCCLVSFCVAVYSPVWHGQRSRGKTLLRACLSICVCLAVIAVLRADPGQVVTWFMD